MPHTPRSRYIRHWHEHCKAAANARQITPEALAGMVLASHHNPGDALFRLRSIRRGRPHRVMEEAERLIERL